MSDDTTALARIVVTGCITPRQIGAIIANITAQVGNNCHLEVTYNVEAQRDSPNRIDYDAPIDELGLSERPRNCLARGGVHTVGDLLEKSVDDLLTITGFGMESLREVIGRLLYYGLALKSFPRHTDSPVTPRGAS